MANASTYYSSSPVVASLPPVHTDQYFSNSHYTPATNGMVQTSGSINGAVPPSAGSNSPTRGALAGRKRSRGEIYEDGEQEPLEDGSIPTPLTQEPSVLRGKPIFGPGMTMMHPERPGYESSAESQSGTWLDENGAPQVQQHRPTMTARKSQRKEAPSAASDDLAQLVLPPQMREATSEPLIDEATRMLGISWTRMDSSEALLINQAAYSKWIQNYYPGLREVSVWFENSAIPGYLAQAWNIYASRKEWYIFSHDLTEARLVTTEPAQLIPRLGMLPHLHLAAPGGHLRAESDPITVSQNQITDLQAEVREGGVGASILCGNGQPGGSPSYSPGPMCAAHAMELD